MFGLTLTLTQNCTMGPSTQHADLPTLKKRPVHRSNRLKVFVYMTTQNMNVLPSACQKKDTSAHQKPGKRTLTTSHRERQPAVQQTALLHRYCPVLWLAALWPKLSLTKQTGAKHGGESPAHGVTWPADRRAYRQTPHSDDSDLYFRLCEQKAGTHEIRLHTQVRSSESHRDQLRMVWRPLPPTCIWIRWPPVCLKSTLLSDSVCLSKYFSLSLSQSCRLA